MAGRNDWYIPERTRALAIMHLTRRPDLVVKPEGADLLVEVGEGERDEWRAFRVALAGSKAGTTIEGANRHLNRHFEWPGATALVHRTPSPACVFYFTMEDDAGYYTWLAEPIVGAGSARLKVHAEADCRVLDRTALDEIVATVRGWYDAFYSAILA